MLVTSCPSGWLFRQEASEAAAKAPLAEQALLDSQQAQQGDSAQQLEQCQLAAGAPGQQAQHASLPPEQPPEVERHQMGLAMSLE
jgi:hypothetical protein